MLPFCSAMAAFIALGNWRPVEGVAILRGEGLSRKTRTVEIEEPELNELEEEDSLFGPSFIDVINGVAADADKAAEESARLGVHRSDQRGDRYRALWGSGTSSGRHAFRSGRSGFQRAALCVTGHVRTFVLPGVSDSWVKNLITTNPGGPVDTFFFGHLGHYGKHASTEALSAQDVGLKKALANPSLRVKHAEITQSGSCDDLGKSWGKNLTDCNYSGRYLQVMWMDRCVQMVMQEPERYDLIIRMRPDVGVFNPIPWGQMSTTKVNYMKRHVPTKVKFPPQAGEDWFFTLPRRVVHTYWGRVMEYYEHELKEKEIRGTPDGLLFRDAMTRDRADGMSFSEALKAFGSHHVNRTNTSANATNASKDPNAIPILLNNFHTRPASYTNDSLVEHLFFPATIVRFPQEAKNFQRVVECSRIGQVQMMQECERIAVSGFFFPYNESFYPKNPPHLVRLAQGLPRTASRD